MIRIENVEKSFASTKVLSNLNFEVATASSVALVGLSGSGKTTILKLLCGLHSADSGSIFIQGNLLTASNILQIRRSLGYVIQDGGLFPHLNARQNLELVGLEAGMSHEEIQSRLTTLSEMTRIATPLLDRYPKELSGGQRQRIGIMRALMLDPPILLLDEPFGALDPITKKSLQHDLRRLFSEMKKTVVLVTHDLFEANYMTDSILLLNKGQIEQRGKLRDFIQQPASEFVKLFVGSQRQEVDPLQ